MRAPGLSTGVRSARPWQPADTVRIAIISCVQRATERVKTLQQFRNIGLTPVFEPYLNECTHAGNTGAQHGRVWFEKALSDFLETDEVGMVIAEDDIDVKPAFRQALELAVMGDDFVDFCIWRDRHHPPDVKERVRERRPIPPGMYVIDKANGWYGTQCVYLPRWLVELYMGDSEFRAWNSAFDSVLAQVIKRNQVAVVAAYPNPVQHRSPHSIAELVRGNGDRGLRQSDTYNLPPTTSWSSLLRARGVSAYGADVRPDGSASE